ncbi:MAG: NADH-quinone oxidoreductase subunit A [Candidatus Woesearchaeota archaeon]|nr:NADH-quinone oxidoreductase subunit A [Candidatus Woesearchaeota archaeon]
MPIGFVLGNMLLSWLLRPLKTTSSNETYECGMIAQGTHREIGFNFINYATLFLVFDIATIYLFLFAVAGITFIGGINFVLGLATLCLIILYGTKRRSYLVT